MLLLLLILISFAIAIIINKGFKGSEGKEIHGTYLIIIGFFIQIAIFNTKFAISKFNKFTPVFYILSLFILLIFLILNLSYKGIIIALSGFLMNMFTIILNNGYMPQDINKLISIGETEKVEYLKQFGHFYNAIIMSNKTHFNFLADRIVFPFLKSFGGVYSMGDVIIVIGICFFIFEYLAKE